MIGAHTMQLALDRIEAAAVRVANAEEMRARNDMEKMQREAEIIASLVGNPNPMTGKPHSASSAAEAASNDPAFMEFRERRIAYEGEVTMARAAYEVAKLRATYYANGGEA